ncbi:MAG: CopG family ribbon-helix-helix protein [Candidatus Binatia bacterium]
MARFMISMPDEMLKKLDRRAREEHRTRSELLREAARHHLAAIESESPPQSRDGKQKGRKKWTRDALEQYLLERGVAHKGCPGLDPLVGPVKGPVDMKRILRIGKKLTGLSRQIIEDREDRV